MGVLLVNVVHAKNVFWIPHLQRSLVLGHGGCQNIPTVFVVLSESDVYPENGVFALAVPYGVGLSIWLNKTLNFLVDEVPVCEDATNNRLKAFYNMSFSLVGAALQTPVAAVGGSHAL